MQERDELGFESVEGKNLNMEELSKYINKYQEEHPINVEKEDIS